MLMTMSLHWLWKSSAGRAVQPSTARAQMYCRGGRSIISSQKETMLNKISFTLVSMLFFISVLNLRKVRVIFARRFSCVIFARRFFKNTLH